LIIEQVGVTGPTELRAVHFSKNGGKGLLNKHGNSPQSIIDSLNVDTPFSPEDTPSNSQARASFKSSATPRNFWVSNHPNILPAMVIW